MSTVHRFAKTKKSCEKQRNNFTEKNVEFVRCTMQHTLPVTYCTSCIEPYVVQLQTYQKFIETHEGSSDSGTCGAKYLNRDQLNILVKSYEGAKRLWDIGSCSSEYLSLNYLDFILSQLIAFWRGEKLCYEKIVWVLNWLLTTASGDIANLLRFN